MTGPGPLDHVGELIISQVRDAAIRSYDRLVSGHWKAREDRVLHNRLQELSPDQLAVVRDVAVEMVDTTIHNVLWMLENREDVDLTARTDDGGVTSMRDASDGLSGELYSKRGWIYRFSAYKRGH